MTTDTITRQTPGRQADAPTPRPDRDPRPKASRAITRLATNTVRASGWRGVLVVALIALSVAIAAGAALLSRTAAISDDQAVTWSMGRADAVLTHWLDTGREVDLADLSPVQRAHVEATLEAREEAERAAGIPIERVPEDAEADRARDEAALAELTSRGLIEDRVVLTELQGWEDGKRHVLWAGELDHPLADGILKHEGPLPVPGTDQALVSPRWLADLGAEVGDRVTLPWVGEVEVVGTVTLHRNLSRAAVVAPDAPFEAMRTNVERHHLVDVPDVDALAEALWGPEPVLTDRGFSGNLQLREQHPEYRTYRTAADQVSQDPGFLGSLLAAVLLAQVGFVAAAAFATGTRRRIRELGLLGAAGASPAQVASLVRREGLVLGTLGGVLGVVIAVVAAWLGLPVVERVADHTVEGLRLAPQDLLGPALLGAAAALLAAWLPARTVAKVPTTAALAGRVPLARVTNWVTPVALATSTFGVLTMLWVGRLDHRGLDETAFFVAGVVAVLVGMATLGVPMIGTLAGVADRLPAVLRLAVRDAGRQRTRSAAAVAALSVVMVVPVLTSIAFATEVARWPTPDPTVVAIEGGWFEDVDLPADQAEVDALLEGFEVVDRTQATEVSDRFTNFTVTRGNARFGLSAAVATPGLVDLLEIDDAGRTALTEGRSLLLGGERWTAAGPGTTEVEYERAGPWTTNPTSRLLPVEWADPGRHLAKRFDVLVPLELATELGLAVTPDGTTFVELATPLTTDQRDLLDQRDDASIAWVVMPHGNEPPIPFTAAIFLASLLAALVVLGLVTALAATESDKDLGLMTAVGAPPSIRRRFHAAQGALHALLGSGIALVAGILLWSAADPGQSTVLPWGVLALLVLGVPLVAGAVLGLVMRSAKVAAPRRIA